MARVVLGELPFVVQVLVIYPVARIAVLDEDLGRSAVSGYVDYADGIHVQAPEGILSELKSGNGLGSGLVQRRGDALPDFSGTAVKDHELEIP